MLWGTRFISAGPVCESLFTLLYQLPYELAQIMPMWIFNLRNDWKRARSSCAPSGQQQTRCCRLSVSPQPNSTRLAHNPTIVPCPAWNSTLVREMNWLNKTSGSTKLHTWQRNAGQVNWSSFPILNTPPSSEYSHFYQLAIHFVTFVWSGAGFSVCNQTDFT